MLKKQKLRYLITGYCFGLGNIGFDWLILVRFDNYQFRLDNICSYWLRLVNYL